MTGNNFQQRIEDDTFVANNGAVIRVINITAEAWKRVSIIKRALTELDANEFCESMTFLQKAGYIDIRTIEPERQPIEFCDITDYNLCQVTLTAQGMRLARHAIKDPAVTV